MASECHNCEGRQLTNQGNIYPQTTGYSHVLSSAVISVTCDAELANVVFGERRMTRARWNNILAPILLPFVGFPVGPMAYYVISATRA